MGLLAATLLGTLIATGSAPAEPPPPVRVRVPEPAVRTALELALETRGHLERFQIGPSKFRDGRVRLDALDISPGSAPGRARFVAHASLDYARRRLSVRWRGLRTRRIWKDTGRKDVARVRLTGEVRLDVTGDVPALVASRLRVKVVSRLSPLRGATARFDLGDLRFDLPDAELLGLRLRDVRLEGATTSALLLALDRG